MKQTCSDPEEIWRDIVGYEGLYKDSNLGRVKSLERKCLTRSGAYRIVPERILRGRKNNKGYLQVTLYKDGKGKNHLVHRLVAQSFLDNPLNLPCINHLDENPLNNKANNLEFCTYEYNNNYGTAIERKVKSVSKPVLQLTLDGELVREWPSAHEAQRQGGFNHGHISACCSGRLNTHSGYVWKFKKEIA